MKIYNLIILLALLLVYACNNKIAEKAHHFVKVENGKFTLNAKPYFIIGTNYWYGSNLACLGRDGQERVIRELDYLISLGINNLRIQACSEGGDEIQFGVKPALQTKQGEYNENLFEGLDFLLAEMSKRNMTAVLALNNYWSWTGGMAKYVEWNGGGEIPYPSSSVLNSWSTYMKYADKFYSNEGAKKAFRNHLNVMLNRKNTINGKIYKEDPTIMAWQLANEPRGGRTEEERETFISWIHESSAYIKTLDTNHLVTTGSEGTVGHHWSYDDFEKANNCNSIDYLTFHLWPQNWSWFDPMHPSETIDTTIIAAGNYIDNHEAIAKKLNKPAVLEEFGLARDYGYFSADSSAIYRNKFYDWVFNKTYEIASSGGYTCGTNFWGWSGEGKARRPGENWQPGDDFIGDPPHEAQGWYALYQTDSSSIEVIKNFAIKMKSLNN